MKKRKVKIKSNKRKAIPIGVKIEVLTEAGYRCAACRGILAMELHHMVEVSVGGGDVVENLLALCPNCHTLFHNGVIHRESIYAWKAVLVALTRAYDWNALDHLIFLSKKEAAVLRVSGDGVLPFARLVAAGLATFDEKIKNGPLRLYSVSLTERGKQLVSVWESGDRSGVRNFFESPGPMKKAKK